MELGGFGRQRELKRSAGSGFRFYPDPAAVLLDNLLACRKSDASTRDVATVKTFEEAEDARVICGIDADAVVDDGQDALVAVDLSGDMNLRLFRAAILDRVSDEILKHLCNLHVAPQYDGKSIVRYHSIALDQRFPQVPERGFEGATGRSLA